MNDDPLPRRATGTFAVFEEPPTKAPPLLEVGPLAWLRKNLFSSWFDTILTLIFIVVVVSLVVSFITWATQQADWFVVIFNLRLLMVGRYPAESDGRVVALTAIAAFTVGMGLAAWARVSRQLVIGIVAILVVIFIAPMVIISTISPTPTNVAAGSGQISYSASQETPQPQVAFIAKAGETITVRMADQYSVNDQALGSMVGFSDKAVSLLANAASDRLDTINQIASYNEQLSGDLLTNSQRNRLNIALAKLSVVPSITDTYTVNQGAINVRILSGSKLDPIASGTLKTGSAPVTIKLPADGWYVLEKIPADDSDQGAAVLQVQGVEPLLARAASQSASDADSDTEGQNFDYIRVSDNFTIQDARPQDSDGNNLPMATLIDNPYRGDHTFGDFLRLFIVPFFDAIKALFLLIAVAAAVGYVVGIVADRVASPVEKPRKQSRRAATWLLIAFPVIMFGLIYGIGNILPLTDTRRWGGLLLTIMLTIVSVIASFPIGVALALGRRSTLPAISIASTVYIEFVRGVPLITVLFMGQLLLPLVNPALADTPNVFRAMVAITLFNAAYLAENVRGGLQAVPHGQQEAATALGLSSFQIIIDIMLPQALRAIFPALVGMVIAVFKDTSLVTIVGLLDLTGIGQNVVTQAEFIGQRREVLLFITLLYFAISYVIASVSRRIEKSGAGAISMRRI